MVVRIRFSKYGIVKFVGHLDFMRYFQKAIRRSGIAVVYSKGFHPHQVMSFASPLGVGLTSDGEYLDVELSAAGEKSAMIDCFNQGLNEGCTVTDFFVLPEPEPNKRKETAMSLVHAADYLVSLKDGYSLSKQAFDWKQAFYGFLDQESMVITKKSKKSEKELDLKPHILAAACEFELFAKKIGSSISEIDRKVCNADEYENGIRIFLRLSAGSAMNVKPESVLEAFCSFSKIEYQNFAWQVHRMELLTAQDHGFVPLIPKSLK